MSATATQAPVVLRAERLGKRYTLGGGGPGMLREALMALPVDYREVVVLRHFADLSYGEMAVALAIPEKTVKSRLYSARRRLAGALSETGIR